MTKREKIELLREGYERALRIQGLQPEAAKADAAIVYPFPKRPRTVVVAGVRYRIRDGVVEYVLGSGLGYVRSSFTLDDLRAFGELAANPTEDDV